MGEYENKDGKGQFQTSRWSLGNFDRRVTFFYLGRDENENQITAGKGICLIVIQICRAGTDRRKDYFPAGTTEDAREKNRGIGEIKVSNQFHPTLWSWRWGASANYEGHR